MNFWMKYRSNYSSGPGKWEWEMLYCNTPECAELSACAFVEDIDSDNNWSEHYRGTEYEVTEAPRHVVKEKIKDVTSKLAGLQDSLSRLHDEFETAKECECVGEKSYSCYCMHCGKLLERKLQNE
jgi:hypothetical protein